MNSTELPSVESAIAPTILPSWIYTGGAKKVIVRHIAAISVIAVLLDLFFHFALNNPYPTASELLLLLVGTPTIGAILYLYSAAIHEIGHLAFIKMFRIPTPRVFIGREHPGQIIVRRNWAGIEWTLYAGIGMGCVKEDRDELSKRSYLNQAWFDLVCASSGPIAGIIGALPLIWFAPSETWSHPTGLLSVIGILGAWMVLMNCAAMIPIKGWDGWYAMHGARKLLGALWSSSIGRLCSRPPSR